MKKIHTLIRRILLLIVTGLACFTIQAQTTYYVHATAGNDTNNGTSTNTPWKTLSKLNNTTFTGGDIIKFMAGETFTGSLIISSSGSSGNPIVFDMYGSGVRPILDGQGADYTIYANNKEYLEFKNLQVTNFRSGTITDTDRFLGILIESEDYGTVNHIYLDNIRIYNINSSYDTSSSFTRYYGGLLFYSKGVTLKSNFNDLLVKNSTFENLSRTGVNMRSDWDRRNSNTSFGDSIGDGTTDSWYPSTNVIFRDNIFQDIVGNGLIVRVTTDALVEGNYFDTCGNGISGNAAFNFNTDGTIFQFNEATNTVYNAGDTDARGIDSDYRTKNTIIQYNYIHNNGLGGIVATGGPQSSGFVPERFNINTIIRYNILENNAKQGMHFSGAVDGLEAYNNVIYADNTLNDITVLNFKKWTAWPNNLNFKNNIFYFTGDNISYNYNDGGGSGATNISFSNNIYFGSYADKMPVSQNSQSIPNVTKDNAYSLDNPLFMTLGNGDKNFAIRSGSPAEGTGINYNQPSEDYYGNTITTSSVNIGVYQGPVYPDYQTYKDTVYVAEDAFVRGGTYTNTNYGSNTVVEAKKATENYTREGILKYNLTGIPTNVKKATLRIYASSNTANSYTNYIYGIDDDSWSESTVTMSNRPAVGSIPPFTSFVINSQTGQWYDVDITSFVQQQQLGNSIITLLITDRNSSQYLTRITSKEGTTSQKSHVIVEYFSNAVTRENVIEDAYTRDGSYANTNYGSDTEIHTKKSSTGFNRTGMLKFDTSTQQDSIINATLHFYANSNTANSFKHYIRAYSNSWNENTITHNNRPSVNDTITSVTFNGTSNQWYKADVTSFVQQQKDNGFSHVSFAVHDRDISTYLTRITSKEGNEMLAAYLEIESITKNAARTSGNNSNNSEKEKITKESTLNTKNQSFELFPNPVNNQFTMQRLFSDSDMLVIQIYDIQGRKVDSFVENVKQGLWKKQFNRVDLKLSTGIYLVKLSSSKHGEDTLRFLVY